MLFLVSCCLNNSAASKASTVFWLNLVRDGQRVIESQFQSSMNCGGGVCWTGWQAGQQGSSSSGSLFKCLRWCICDIVTWHDVIKKFIRPC